MDGGCGVSCVWTGVLMLACLKRDISVRCEGSQERIRGDEVFSSFLYNIAT